MTDFIQLNKERSKALGLNKFEIGWGLSDKNIVTKINAAKLYGCIKKRNNYNYPPEFIDKIISLFAPGEKDKFVSAVEDCKDFEEEKKYFSSIEINPQKNKHQTHYYFTLDNNNKLYFNIVQKGEAGVKFETKIFENKDNINFNTAIFNNFPAFDGIIKKNGGYYLATVKSWKSGIGKDNFADTVNLVNGQAIAKEILGIKNVPSSIMKQYGKQKYAKILAFRQKYANILSKVNKKFMYIITMDNTTGKETTEKVPIGYFKSGIKTEKDPTTERSRNTTLTGLGYNKRGFENKNFYNEVFDLFYSEYPRKVKESIKAAIDNGTFFDKIKNIAQKHNIDLTDVKNRNAIIAYCTNKEISDKILSVSKISSKNNRPAQAIRLHPESMNEWVEQLNFMFKHMLYG